MTETSTVTPYFYSSDEVASLFQVHRKWLYRNRQEKAALPFTYIGRKIAYPQEQLAKWLGHDDLQLMIPKQAAAYLGFNERWLRANRASHEPIKYYKLGRLIRYHRFDIEKWIAEYKK